jgi:hypothetical protein
MEKERLRTAKDRKDRDGSAREHEASPGNISGLNRDNPK